MRGKEATSGIFHDLQTLQAGSGDEILKKHLKEAARNARYTSVQTQNELIHICEEIVREKIVSRANKSIGFSVIADETSDISGVEQLSIGIRFLIQNRTLFAKSLWVLFR